MTLARQEGLLRSNGVVTESARAGCWHGAVQIREQTCCRSNMCRWRLADAWLTWSSPRYMVI
eukprot:2942771-Prymnesium_polylepis.1